MCEEQSKARLHDIEAEQANQRLETLQKELDSIKAAASELAQRFRDLRSQLDEMLAAKDDAKEFVRALRCEYKVAAGGAAHHFLLEQMHEIVLDLLKAVVVWHFANPGTTSRETAHRLFFEAHCMPKWNARLAQKDTTHRFIGRWTH